MFYFKILRKETHRKPELVFNLWAQLLQPVFLGGASGKKMVRKLPANAGDIRVAGLIPGSRRSPKRRSGNSLQYSCWEISRTEEPGGYSPWGPKEWT